MKKFLSTLCLGLVFYSFAAHAAPSVSATPLRNKFTVTPVTTSTWGVLVSSTVKAIKGISVMNSSLVPLQIGVALPAASANAEVAQMVVPAGGSQATYFPLVANQAIRVSVLALDNSATTGELQMNLLYN